MYMSLILKSFSYMNIISNPLTLLKLNFGGCLLHRGLNKHFKALFKVYSTTKI